MGMRLKVTFRTEEVKIMRKKSKLWDEVISFEFKDKIMRHKLKLWDIKLKLQDRKVGFMPKEVKSWEKKCKLLDVNTKIIR